MLKKKMIRCFLLGMMLMMPLVVVGQGELRGVVSDEASGARLEYVNVGVVGTSMGVSTDAQGHYWLRVEVGDSVVVRFSSTGYEPYEEKVILIGGERKLLNVRMKQGVKQLDAVEVSQEKSRQSSFTQIEVKHLDEVVGPANGVEALVKMLPDVSSNNELSSQYSVRGGSFDENLVYINGVEVFRPMLIRNGQQEGMSIVNPDLVDYILFSPGGFDATYGDKMSSVLDITYSRPVRFGGKASVSLLGAAASVHGLWGDKFSYAMALRQHSNSYVLGSLDTKGQYLTHYTDFQSVVGYKVNDRLDLGLVAVLTQNKYGLIPESQTTTFGSFMMPLRLRVYFDGQEADQYHTLLGAFTTDYRPSEDWRIRTILSLQQISERERYDVQSQYWLYELALGAEGGDSAEFDRGVGTFLEHARNRLNTGIYSFSVKAERQLRLGSLVMGIGMQMEDIEDHLREWKWVDSAGYTLPYMPVMPGDSNNSANSPILQQYVNAENTMSTWRTIAFVQRELNFTTQRGADIKVVAGVRGQLYRSTMSSNGAEMESPLRPMMSPRLSVNYKPHIKEDMLFRLAAGLYQQSPFYREYRASDGTLVSEVKPQKAYQIVGTMDWNFHMWEKAFKLTADIYYKYLVDVVPYTIDNLRVRYLPDEHAVGYATGLSIRLNGEIVEGLESWAAFSLMKTQEDVEGDGLGWLYRPTDQRVSFKLFLQDNIPDLPWWKMSLSMVVGSGTPVTIPMAARSEQAYRLPTYFRVDWGNALKLSQLKRIRDFRLFNYVNDIEFEVDVFNLFNFHNVISYLWVSDYSNIYYPVPNYLTARQLNFKLTVLF